MVTPRFIRRFSAFMSFAAVCLALIALPGCSPFSTYPPDGTGPRIYPWMAPAPEVMSTGLMQAHARVAPDSDLVFNLPAGISQAAWNDIQNRLGLKARPMQPGDTVVWSIERFGIRNTKAYTDIAYWNDGKAVLLTVNMERDNISPFQVTSLQRFYLQLQAPVCNNPAVTPAEVDVEVAEETDDTGATESVESVEVTESGE